jgi:hypothetical protein
LEIQLFRQRQGDRNNFKDLLSDAESVTCKAQVKTGFTKMSTLTLVRVRKKQPHFDEIFVADIDSFKKNT